jgi:hypothetical protein
VSLTESTPSTFIAFAVSRWGSKRFTSSTVESSDLTNLKLRTLLTRHEGANCAKLASSSAIAASRSAAAV